MGNKPDEKRLDAKIGLLRKLLEIGHPKATIRTLFVFIKYYTSFAHDEFYLKFDEKINPMKNTNSLTLREMIIEDARQEGIQMGIEKGIEKGREEGAILAVSIQLLLLKGMEPSEVAQKLQADLNLVLKIKAELDRLN